MKGWDEGMLKSCFPLFIPPLTQTLSLRKGLNLTVVTETLGTSNF
jgi:hypothetical protein